MGLLDRLRDVFSSSPRIAAGSRDEEAAEREEYGLPDRGDAELHAAEEGAALGGGGAVGPMGAGLGAQEAAETAEADLDELRRPPDPAP